MYPLKIESVEFVRSAAGASDLPCDRLPEVAMVGRSNVGKSSLINSLVRTSVARTSAAPGKTRLINLYKVVTRPTGPFYLVDLPGYGYARKKDAKGEFDRLAAMYFARAAGALGLSDTRPSRVPVGVLLLLDARHPGLDADLETAAWLRASGFDPLVVVTKLDKLSRSERAASMGAFERCFGVATSARAAGLGVFGHAVVGVSATTGEGMDALWKQVASWIATETASSQPPSRP
ncbi:MAG: ribosome biogenesis GTP-binding protein YihA/YsxC [Bacteroidales bacterium]